MAVPVATVEVEEAPPEPIVETYEVRPGFVWIQGRYFYEGGRYVWHGGHYERERVGYIWAPGRWEPRGRGHVWVEGGWRAGGGGAVRAGGGVEVRDHREPAPPPAGPVVRDHRN